jgi:O-antigen ligase
MLAEILSWFVFALILLFFSFPKGRGLGLVLMLSIIFIPILVPSTASDVFLRGNIFRFVGICIFFFILALSRSKKIHVPPLGPFSYYLLYVAVCLLSALVSADPAEAVFRSLTYLEPFAFFLLTLVVSYNDADGFQRIVRWVFLSTLIVVVYGLIQLLTQRDFLSEAGFTNQMSFLGAPINYLADRRTFSGRITTFLAQPVFAAFFFIVALIVALFYFLRDKPRKLFSALSVFSLILLTYTTGTRSAYIVLLLVFFLLFLIYGKRNLRFVALIILVAYVFVGFIISPDVFIYLKDSFDISGANKANVNALQRLDLTGRLYALALKNMWLGFGPGLIQKASIGTTLAYNPAFEGLGGQENQFFVILADTGLFGFAAYALFLWKWFSTVLRKEPNIKNDLKTFKILLAIVSASFFAGSLTVSNLTSVPMTFLFILFAAYYGRMEKEKYTLQISRMHSTTE